VKLADLTAGMLARAVAAYARVAYGQAVPEQVARALSIQGRTYHEILSQMDDESCSGDTPRRRYALRLGNPRYPCMKLVLEEMLFDGEFFFLVDTHDEIELEPGFPDYEDWEELRRYNEQLKHRIERELAASGLPTVEDMRRLAEEDAAGSHARPRGKKILVALREAAESAAVAIELRSRGYEAIASPGPQALIELAAREAPDVVLIARTLRGRSTAALLEALSEPRFEKPPKIVVALARSDRRTRPPRADAVIREPIGKETLFRTLDDLLG